MISSVPGRHNFMYFNEGEGTKVPRSNEFHFSSIFEMVFRSEETTFGHFLENPPFRYAFIVPSIRSDEGDKYSWSLSGSELPRTCQATVCIIRRINSMVNYQNQVLKISSDLFIFKPVYNLFNYFRIIIPVN